MKISKIVIAMLFVAMCSITMGNKGCGNGGQLEVLGESIDVTSEEGGGAEGGDVEGVVALESDMDMPLVDVQIFRSNNIPGKCLMSYVPAEINFFASLTTAEGREMAYMLGLGNADNQDAKDLVDDLAAKVDEIVGFSQDDGEYAILARVNRVGMTEFVDGFLTDLITKFNDARDEEEDGFFSYRILDANTVALSLSEDVMNAVAARVKNAEITEECVFYRINKCSAVSERPMLYVLGKGKTALLDSVLEEGPLSGLSEDIKSAIAVLGVDKKGGVLRFYVGVLDNEDVTIAHVITYFSFYLDTDNPLISLLIDKISDELLNSEEVSEEQPEECVCEGGEGVI